MEWNPHTDGTQYKAPEATGKQTTRRFRVCDECGELFHMVKTAKAHHAETGHSGINHITAEVQE